MGYIYKSYDFHLGWQKLGAARIDSTSSITTPLALLQVRANASGHHAHSHPHIFRDRIRKRSGIGIGIGDRIAIASQSHRRSAVSTAKIYQNPACGSALTPPAIMRNPILIFVYTQNTYATHAQHERRKFHRGCGLMAMREHSVV